MHSEYYQLIPLRAKDGSIKAFTKVDSQDYHKVKDYRWCLHSHGYAARKTKQINNVASKAMLLHRQILEVDYGVHKVQVDHINGDKLDNRRKNLRIATPSENGQSRVKLSSLNKSGYRGVYWCKKEKKYISCAVIKRKDIF